MSTDTYNSNFDAVVKNSDQVLPTKPSVAKVNRPIFADMPNSSQIKVMMIDDETLNIFVVAEYLKSAGYRQLIHTEDPKQALALALRTRPNLILLDIHMPGLNGLEVLQQIRADATLGSTTVVMLTASTDSNEMLDAFDAGANDFLQKPIHCGELLARLQNVLLAKAYQDRRRMKL
jgi:putative two-component system response regulator